MIVPTRRAALSRCRSQKEATGTPPPRVWFRGTASTVGGGWDVDRGASMTAVVVSRGISAQPEPENLGEPLSALDTDPGRTVFEVYHVTLT